MSIKPKWKKVWSKLGFKWGQNGVKIRSKWGQRVSRWRLEARGQKKRSQDPPPGAQGDILMTFWYHRGAKRETNYVKMEAKIASKFGIDLGVHS